jgi:SAM-dependent methyltransferase
VAPGDETDPTRIFDKLELYEQWDDDYYHPLALKLYDRAVGDLLDLLRAPAGALVLDAGCGPGVHSIRAAQRGYRVRALDVSQTALDEAAQRADKAGVADAIEFQQADLTDLQLADASFDHVFCWGVVIHIPEIAKALDHLARVVAPGGRLALQVTNCAALDHKLEGAARRLLSRPNEGLERRDFGEGCVYDVGGDSLWVWQLDLPYLTRYLEGRGLILKERRAVEFTHHQRRIPRALRPLLLHLNNGWYRMRGSAALAATNLLVFEKS